MQARNYAETDHLLPEEQWAQITFQFNLKSDDESQTLQQYNMFERRLADKLSYMDWKLSYVIDLDDFEFLHAKSSIQTQVKKVQKDVKQASAV